MILHLLRTPAQTGLLATACLLLAVGAAHADYPVADWTLETVDGKVVRFHDELDKGPVVMGFWATWCKPCLKELPHLEELAAQHAGRITFLAVNTDNTRAVAKVGPYVSSAGFEHLKVPLDTGGIVQQQMQMGGILPFLVVYDGNGREIYQHIGYKEGDELELAAVLEEMLAATAADMVVDTGKPAWAEAVTATDRMEYSYSTVTKREIFDNWLDVAYQFGGFRTGILLKSEAPGEEGDRVNEIRHRFFEFDSGGIKVRAGHFYGIFGRGLVFNAYEDRTVRVDTRLDGMVGSYRHDRGGFTAFSGSPTVPALDLRGGDAYANGPVGLRIGVSGMTWRPDTWVGEDDEVRREWVATVRLQQKLSFAEWYLEHGRKKGWDYTGGDDNYDMGSALYANVNLFQGPFSFSWEHSNYERFVVVPGADGTTALNRPPSLTRDFAWTLMNRAPHPTDANDERGHNLDAIFSDGGWTALLSGVRLENQDLVRQYELAWASLKAPRTGDFRLAGGFGYQDNEGLRQTVVGEVIWYLDTLHSLTLQAEHQHVRPDFVADLDEGAYDEEFFSLEYKMAPTWSFTGILELNNKFDEQQAPDEQDGPFAAGQISYTLARGGNLNLWFGERQAGFLCSGGVCKFEPAFEGVELFGIFRY